jgi:hypothetical protein
LFSRQPRRRALVVRRLDVLAARVQEAMREDA